MDRNFFAEKFTLDDYPSWPCPHCNRGFLQINKSKFHYEQTKASIDAASHPDYEPIWQSFIYNAFLECTHRSCNSTTMSVGIGVVENANDNMSFDDYLYEVFENYFTPKFFIPSLKIINIPLNCPKKVSEALEQSFELFFCNPSSCCNIIRTSLEYLLTEIGIATTEISKNKQKSLDLHTRIGKIQNTQISQALLAVKWLGNTASHTIEGLSHKDALDAYEILEYVLKQLFEDPHTPISNMVSQINQNKGPIK